MEFLIPTKVPRSKYSINKKKSIKRYRSNLRLFIEGIIMIFVGTNLLFLLISIPEEFIFNDFYKYILTNLLDGLGQLFLSLRTIGISTSILLLILFSIFLEFGGLVRLFRIICRQKPLKIRSRKSRFKGKY
tara:strand:+ start:163 stop:555 length:393 start_codon:yes stop_codon:yes gene_type:complete